MWNWLKKQHHRPSCEIIVEMWSKVFPQSDVHIEEEFPHMLTFAPNLDNDARRQHKYLQSKHVFKCGQILRFPATVKHGLYFVETCFAD